MKRKALDGGGWFDAHKATEFDEGQYHDGSNFISRSTGSQWEHESLYLTASGRFVLCAWSQWQGTRTTYTQISVDDAADWFSKNEYPEQDIPAQCSGRLAETEV